MAARKQVKIYCGKCRNNTNHKILAELNFTSDPEDDYPYGIDHYFGQCAGCDSICYGIASWSQDDWDPISGEVLYHWQTYPRSKGERSPIDDFESLPQKIRVIYQEVVDAINAQLNILAAIGLRAVIEAICVDREVKGKNLEQLIDGLAKNGDLSQNQADILHGHRFMGNAAAHEIQAANPVELVAALEISETVLRTIYIIPELSKKIRTGRILPARAAS